MTSATEAPPARPRALIVDADPALAALIEEWLDEHGWCATRDAEGEAPIANGYDVIVLDVPYARRDGLELVGRVAARHPGTPIVALSASFFAGVDSSASIARSLGAACVLPKPLAREALIAALRRVLPRPE
jgi:DNA-binding response OmpR family regulator